MRLLFLALLLIPSICFAQEEQSAFERIKKANTIRCGYWIEYPLTIKNLNTGKMEGIVPDIMAEFADELGMQVEWTEEITAANMIEGLNTGRYDALCAGIMMMTSRAHLMEHSIPFIFTPLVAYVRADDTRFDEDIFIANAPEYKIIGLDGSGKTLIAIKRFNKADIIMLPQFSSFAELFVNVADKKADMTFTIPAEFKEYNMHNPDKLKPVGLFSNIPLTFTYKQGETELKNMFDTIFLTLAADGRLDEIIDKWEKDKGDFYRATLPYRK